MTTITMTPPRPRAVGRSFYLIMSLLMAAVIVGGFSQTVPGDFRASHGFPLLMQIHGAVFTLWCCCSSPSPPSSCADRSRCTGGSACLAQGWPERW